MPLETVSAEGAAATSDLLAKLSLELDRVSG
jgi:hypothetical protein